jgi:hypothetical protein
VGSSISWDQEKTTRALPRKVVTVPPLHDHHSYWLSDKLSGVTSGPGSSETPAMYGATHAFSLVEQIRHEEDSMKRSCTTATFLMIFTIACMGLLPYDRYTAAA